MPYIVEPKTENQFDSVYCFLMQEVKVRVGYIDALLNNTSLPIQLVRESSYLQLRLICETVALGCLIAHNTLGANRKLKKFYSADKIMAALGKLHPDFYPKPVTISKQPDGSFHAVPVTSAHLEKSDMIKLVRDSGDILHKGGLKSLYAKDIAMVSSVDEIRDLNSKVATLLRQHWIQLGDKKTNLFCILGGPHQNVTMARTVAL